MTANSVVQQIKHGREDPKFSNHVWSFDNIGNSMAHQARASPASHVHHREVLHCETEIQHDISLSLGSRSQNILCTKGTIGGESLLEQKLFQGLLLVVWGCSVAVGVWVRVGVWGCVGGHIHLSYCNCCFMCVSVCSLETPSTAPQNKCEGTFCIWGPALATKSPPPPPTRNENEPRLLKYALFDCGAQRGPKVSALHREASQGEQWNLICHFSNDLTIFWQWRYHYLVQLILM